MVRNNKITHILQAVSISAHLHNHNVRSCVYLSTWGCPGFGKDRAKFREVLPLQSRERIRRHLSCTYHPSAYMPDTDYLPWKHEKQTQQHYSVKLTILILSWQE